MTMKIYTKKGDQGKTSLIGGDRVLKSHERVEAYGTVDELLATIGISIDLISDKSDKDFLITIQSDLFTIGSHLACTKDSIKLPAIPETRIEEMEKVMDNITNVISELKHFILPGGHLPSSQLHLARTVCRRAERKVTLLDGFETKEMIIQYLNRLSDLLFIFIRHENHINNIEEIKWLPDKS